MNRITVQLARSIRKINSFLTNISFPTTYLHSPKSLIITNNC